jgi:hypothetical protein
MPAKSPKQLDFETALKRRRKIQVNGSVHTVGEILDDPVLKKYFVDENPLEAFQFYNVCQDYEFGIIFANTYSGHPEYGGMARDIGNGLGLLCVQELESNVKLQADNVRVFDRDNWAKGLIKKTLDKQK